MKTAFFNHPQLILFIAFAALVTFTSCEKKIRKNGSGMVTSTTRNLVGFTDLDVDGNFDLFIHQGAESRVVITTDDNMVNEVQTFVQDGKLFIEMSDDYHNYHFSRMEVHVYSAYYNRFDFNGEIKAICEDTLETVSFVANHNGSGYTQLIFNGENLDITTRGSADIHAIGEVEGAKYSINGSGKFDALSLSAQVVDANIYGSGSMYLNCTESLDATIDGSGKIRYTGNPVTSTHISGSGSVAPN